MKQLQSLENLIPDIEMPVFQNIGVQKALLNKKMLLAFDTGTGKTFTYSLFVRALLNRDPEKKHIFVVIHDSIDQAPEDIRSMVSAPVGVFTAKAEDIQRLGSMWDKLSVIILTYEVFRIPRVCLFLYNRIKQVESITIDEAHHVSNWDVSDTAFLIRSLVQYVPYVIELTATPMTSHSSQYFHLMNLLDRNLSHRRNETPTGKYNERYMPVNREDYDIKGSYKTTLEVVTPHPYQLGEIKGIVSKVIKGTGALNQVNTLLKVVRERIKEGKSVIVYINYHDTREWVEQHFNSEGIPFVSLHGRVTKSTDRQKILNQYASGEVRVLLTSIAESLNIDSDVVVFYEFTTKLKQVMGRAHRGLSGKELELVFIVTKDTQEVDFFLKYIYKRSLTIQKLLGKDYSEFIRIGGQVKELQAITDEDY